MQVRTVHIEVFGTEASNNRVVGVVSQQVKGRRVVATRRFDDLQTVNDSMKNVIVPGVNFMLEEQLSPNDGALEAALIVFGMNDVIIGIHRAKRARVVGV